MLSRRLIPCLDVRDGLVVKGVRFRDHVVVGAIEELALRYRDEGADELVFYDITASPAGRTVDRDWIERVSRIIDIPFCVAGGIRSVVDARAVLNAGADKVSINSAAVRTPEFVREAAERFGSQCIVVNIDPRRVERSEAGGQRPEEGGGSSEGENWPEHLRVRPRTAPDWWLTRHAADASLTSHLSPLTSWDVHINGGRVPTGLDAVEWAKEMERLGAGEIVLTSMDADGTKDGYDLEIIRAVAEAVTIPVVASGGAGSPQHIYEALTAGQADAALAASIFHYGTHPVPEVKQYLEERGVVVRR
ncbi:MAG: imidazole glycerol phosphate synthase subunit HisF [Planctomycetaceae bacterium]|nr:imidazole glycerol phosphate synthase subunit HisF [Planctomycetaceae bacterium]